MVAATATQERGIIPNSHQIPNLYSDRYMAFLTSEEWKVLTYTARRIFGFNKRSDRISLSQYTSGTKSIKGEHLDYGTGLSLAAVRRALKGLIKFGLIIAGENGQNNDGTLYSLELDEQKIKLEALQERHEKQTKANTQKSEKARQAATAKRKGSLSDRPPLSHSTPNVPQTPTPYVGQTPGGTVAQKHNIQGNPEETQRIHFGEPLPRSPDTAPPPIQEPLNAVEAIQHFAGLYGGIDSQWINAEPLQVPLIPVSQAEQSPLDSKGIEEKVNLPPAPEVVNIHDVPTPWPADHVYIGRENSRNGLEASKWANPYPMQKESDRIDVIARYQDYLLDNPTLLRALPELRGKTLVCWCEPKPCHGDVLAKFAVRSDSEIEMLAKKAEARQQMPPAPDLPPVPEGYEAVWKWRVDVGSKPHYYRHYRLIGRETCVCGVKEGEMRGEGFSRPVHDEQCPKCTAKLAFQQMAKDAKAAKLAERQAKAAEKARKPSAYANQDLFDAIGAMLGFKDKADVNANGWLIGEIRKPLVTWALEKLNVQDLTKDHIDRLKARLDAFPEWYAKECKGCDLPGHKLFMKWWTKYAGTFTRNGTEILEPDKPKERVYEIGVDFLPPEMYEQLKREGKL